MLTAVTGFGITSDAAAIPKAGTETLIALNGLSTSAYGYTEWSAFYRRYKVKSVHFDVTACIPSGAAVCVMGISVPGDTFSTTGFAQAFQLCEKPRIQVKAMLSGTPTAVWNVQEKHAAQSLTSLSPLEYAANVENYAALVGAVPAQVSYLVLNVAGMVATSQVVVFYVRLVQEIEFFERIILAS